MNEQLVIGMDVGSTTVKAVVVDPATKEILWSDYQRHHTKQPEYVLSMLETILAALPGSARADGWRIFLTGSGAAPLCAPTGGKFVQEVNAVTLAVEHLHPDVGSRHRARRAGREDHHVQEGREDAARRPPTASMNDKCASRHRRDHRQVLPQGERAARARDAASLRRLASSTTSRPSAASSPRPTSSTSSRAASRRTRCSARSPTRSSSRTSPSSRAAARSSTACSSSAGRTRTCRSSRSAGACASRRRGTSAATTTRRTCPIEELIFVPKNAQYYAALGAVLYGLHEDDARRRLRRRSTGCAST